MKALANKPSPKDTVSAKRNGTKSDVDMRAIKLKAVTAADRQRLRIPSYQYILP